MEQADILIVDDNPEIREIIQILLSGEGYQVHEAANGHQALMLLRQTSFDLIILDIMMPGLNGYPTCLEIRKISNAPILFLSARTQESDKTLGFSSGGDDYLAKPFNPLEAVARVNSNIRRFYSLGTKVVQEGNLAVRDLVLNQDACTLKKGDKIIQLTSVEYRIMELLMKHPGKVFTKQQIYEHGWGEDYIVADNNIMVCISKLRAKLDDNPSAYIQTIRGLGYRLEK